MPRLYENPNQLQLWIQSNQINEAKLAKKIYDVFNSGTMLERLQTFAGMILNKMGTGGEAPFKAAIGAENRLRFWRHMPKAEHTTQQEFIWFADAPIKLKRLDASDCSDIIRLSGEWIERGGLAAPGATTYGKKGAPQNAWNKNQTVSDSIKDAFRPGPQGQGSWKNKVDATWADGKGRFEKVTIKRRDRGPGRPVEDHLKPYMRKPDDFSGMQGKRLQGFSNILRIDNLFGLVRACDISGTTADTVFALECWGHSANLTSIYYMLPLGTIVHNMHHSIIEVAADLSLNLIIDYHIGFYTTLIPIGCTSIPSDITAAVTLAENSQENRHMLVYYKGVKPEGCMLFLRDELSRLSHSDLTKVAALVKRASTLWKYPTKKDVLGLYNSYNLGFSPVIPV